MAEELAGRVVEERVFAHEKSFVEAKVGSWNLDEGLALRVVEEVADECVEFENVAM